MSAPSKSPIQVSDYPKLDDKQAGHIRHFHNLVSQRDGEWYLFSTADAHQEFDDATRYQLATMAYAAGAAHFHRLPALRGPFQRLMRQMIHKMLRREVWGYWFNASHGGRVFDPDLKELRKPWADPVIKENIMYSGHLLLMTSLYAMLFDDDEFERPGGLTFKWDPLFWGLGKEDFVYDNRSLQKVIFQQMEDNDWVGVCCEPNAVFVVCNQFPLVAMRYNDVRDNTNKTDEVLTKYKAALTRKGMLGTDGLYASFYAMKQQKAIPARHGAHTAWANAFMNGWYPDLRSAYDKQTLGFLTHFDNKTQLQPTSVAATFRKLVLEDHADPNDPATLRTAKIQSKDYYVQKIPFETLNWLAFTMMLSEFGKTKELNDLLDYADTHCNPTWEKGGLYYPRNETVTDDQMNYTHMEPHSGNSGIGYARLNVENGQKRMWENPWTRESVANRPWVDGVGFADDIDFLRGDWDEENRAVVVTVRRWCGETRSMKMVVRNLGEGTWAVYVDGQLKVEKPLESPGEIEIEADVGMDEVDIVVVQI